MAALRWLKSGEKFKAEASDKHQLIYLMEGKGSIRLDNKDYDVSKGAGVYLGPSETATIQPADGCFVEALASGGSADSRMTIYLPLISFRNEVYDCAFARKVKEMDFDSFGASVTV